MMAGPPIGGLLYYVCFVCDDIFEILNSNVMMSFWHDLVFATQYIVLCKAITFRKRSSSKKIL